MFCIVTDCPKKRGIIPCVCHTRMHPVKQSALSHCTHCRGTYYLKIKGQKSNWGGGGGVMK